MQPPDVMDKPGRVIRLSGRTLAIIRWLWSVTAILATLTFILALPLRWTMLLHPSPLTQANLTALGLTPTFFAMSMSLGEIMMGGAYALVGFIIFWRCRDERLALLASLILVVFGMSNGSITPTIHALLGLHPAIDLLIRSFEFIAWFGIAFFFYTFPNGRFVPNWTRWAALVWLPICILWNFYPDTPLAPLNWPAWLSVPMIAISWFTWLFSQIYRYRRVSTTIERQQTKWVVFAVICIILTMGSISIVGAFVPGYNLMSQEQPNPPSFGYMLVQVVFSPVFAFLPLAILFSMIRYRLFDIDVIIRRTLLYALLTALLGLVYFGGVVLLQQVFGLISGGAGKSRAAIVVSTLLIALLFNPLRLRLQAAIDRRFYRRKYDAEKALAAFAISARKEVVIENLTSALLSVVEDTMQPSQVILWMKARPADRNDFKTPGR